MGNIILVVVYVWLGIGFLFTIISYIVHKEFRPYLERNPLLMIPIFMVMGVQIIVYSIIAGTKDTISEKRKQKEHQEDS